MYTAYFGLSEAPFTIAPDPAYLFMSDRHREALAHLSYGLGNATTENSGGFVLLTGEVGTGKTTISRSVMEKLPENTQVAFILNPTLSCEELLACICDNLKIRSKKTGATLKYLTDKIQDKLLKNHHDNINTLLIIDEAQHLKPEVLEQLRLLTNLETNTKKLLQVILIGQPELQQLLQRRDLRQLAQRITARYHLLPLTKTELSHYIKHRLAVAHCTRQLFNKSAIAALHKISQGIPRVVNLLCDRALIIAYGNNDTVIGKKIIQQAAIEALGETSKKSDAWQVPVKGVFASILLSTGLFSVYWFGFQEATNVTVDSQENAMSEKVLAKLDDLTTSLNNIENKQKALEEQNTKNNLDNLSEQGGNIEGESLDNQLNEQQPRILGYQPEKLKPSQELTQLTKSEPFEIVAKPGVSEDLLTRFKDAVNETQPIEDNLNSLKNVENEDEQASQYAAIHQMSEELQSALPALQFEMHIFATDGQGWVRVNGKDKHEGEIIADGVLLTKILPQHVVLNFNNEIFTLPALSNW